VQHHCNITTIINLIFPKIIPKHHNQPTQRRLLMIDINKVGTKEWNDSAEEGEWAFMAKMLREAQASDQPGSNTGVGVAIQIADARAKSGWRNVTDKPTQRRASYSKSSSSSWQ
jgi:hypothetical protein